MTFIWQHPESSQACKARRSMCMCQLLVPAEQCHSETGFPQLLVFPSLSARRWSRCSESTVAQHPRTCCPWLCCAAACPSLSLRQRPGCLLSKTD
jgi:hypothetical protein